MPKFLRTYYRNIFSVLEKDVLLNIISNGAINFINVLIPVLIQFRIVRILSFSNIGDINLLLASQSWLLLFSTAFHWYLINRIAKNTSINFLAIIISNYLAFALFLNLILSFFSFIYFVFFTDIDLSLCILSLFTIVLSTFGSDYYYQSKLLNAFILKRKLLVKVIFLVLVYIVIVKEDDYILYFSLLSLSLMIDAILSSKDIIKIFRFETIKFKIIRKMIWISAKLLMFNVSYAVLPILFTLSLPYYLDSEEVGIFSTMIKIFTLATGFITSMAIVFLPKSLIKNNNSFNDFLLKTSILTFLLATVVASIFFFSKDLIIYLFLDGNTFDNQNFIFLCGYLVLHSLFNHVVFNFYVRKESYLFLILVNLVVILFFVIWNVFFRMHFPITAVLFSSTLFGLFLISFKVIISFNRVDNMTKR